MGSLGLVATTRASTGSPILVLDALIDHADFANWISCEFVLLFNEFDPERFESLGEVLAELRKEGGPWPSNVRLLDPQNQSFDELGRRCSQP